MGDLGFGTIFDGTSDVAALENVSTQVVMELMKNVKVPEADPGSSSFIQLDQNEIDSFCIPRSDSNMKDLSNALGEFNDCGVNKCCLFVLSVIISILNAENMHILIVVH